MITREQIEELKRLHDAYNQLHVTELQLQANPATLPSALIEARNATDGAYRDLREVELMRFIHDVVDELEHM